MPHVEVKTASAIHGVTAYRSGCPMEAEDHSEGPGQSPSGNLTNSDSTELAPTFTSGVKIGISVTFTEILQQSTQLGRKKAYDEHREAVPGDMLGRLTGRQPAAASTPRSVIRTTVSDSLGRSKLQPTEVMAQILLSFPTRVHGPGIKEENEGND